MSNDHRRMMWNRLAAVVCTVVLRLIVLVASNQPHFLPKKMPIGSLFSNSSTLAHAAFQYELEKYNNGPSSAFKLDVINSTAQFTDNFNVSKTLCSSISKGILSLLGLTNRVSLNTIDAFASTFHMPYVTSSVPTNDSTTNQELRFTLYLQPLSDRAVIDVIKYYQWPKIFYIYDSNEGLYRLERLYAVVNAEEIRIQIEPVRLVDVSHCYLTLRQMDAQDERTNKYILVDLTGEDAMHTFLKQIQAVGMNRGGYHYLLTGVAMDELDLADFRHGGVNITGFNLINRTSLKVQIVQKDWLQWCGTGHGTKLKLEAGLMMDAVSVIVNGLTSMLNVSHDVLRSVFRRGNVYYNDDIGVRCKQSKVMPWPAGRVIMNSFTDVQFEGVTGFVAFDQHGFRKNYRLGVYEVTLDNDSKQVGFWESKNGLNMAWKETQKKEHDKEITPINRTRIITTIKSPPFLDLRKRPDDGTVLSGNERYEGYCSDLAREVADIVGFEYVLRLVRDNAYGAKSEHGTWNGMVGELTRKEADVAIAPLTITSIRERVIDFSKPFMNLGISIMIKKPEKQKPGVFSFMDPLASDIWMCIVISYLGVSFVLFLVSRFSPYEWQIEDKEDGPSFTNDFNMLNSLWFSLGAFMRQGCDISPRSLSGRVVGSAWWFFTLIMISSYTANLAAFLTVERMLTPIQNVDDLAKQTEIMYGTLDSGSTKDFFRNSKISTYEKMWEFMSSHPEVFVEATELGVQRVRNSKGKYAFLLESTMNDYYNQKKNCNTMKVGGDLDFKGYGIATPIGSDLREPIGLAVLQLLEKGTLQKLHKRWWYDKGECLPEDSKQGGSSQSALTLSNVAGIFYILIGGLGLSMVMSLLEFLYKSRKEILRQKKTFTEDARPKSRVPTASPLDREKGAAGKRSLTISALPPSTTNATNNEPMTYLREQPLSCDPPVSTFSYTAPSQMSGFEEYAEIRNTQTQV